MIKLVCNSYAFLLGTLIVLVILVLGLYVAEHYGIILELDPSTKGDKGLEKEQAGNELDGFFNRHGPVVVALAVYTMFCVLIGPLALLCDIRTCAREMVEKTNGAVAGRPENKRKIEPKL